MCFQVQVNNRKSRLNSVNKTPAFFCLLEKLLSVKVLHKFIPHGFFQWYASGCLGFASHRPDGGVVSEDTPVNDSEKVGNFFKSEQSLAVSCVCVQTHSWTNQVRRVEQVFFSAILCVGAPKEQMKLALKHAGEAFGELNVHGVFKTHLFQRIFSKTGRISFHISRLLTLESGFSMISSREMFTTIGVCLHGAGSFESSHLLFGQTSLSPSRWWSVLGVNIKLLLS